MLQLEASLRICDLRFNEASTLGPTLNMFDQLQQLDLIQFTRPNTATGLDKGFELNLPMLANIHLQGVEEID